jgi:hypothetical protein
MRETDCLPAAAPAHPVWAALFHYSIGPEDAALHFPDRLARENGWSRTKADRVIGEYKRFCFLAATAGHEVTPSDAVDQAWHLHLTYTRDYWERFCPDVLGRPLHHNPTAQRLIEDPKARRLHPRDGFIVSRNRARFALLLALSVTAMLLLPS